MDCFNDRVVLITGAGTGIGEQTAVDFARHGAKVVLTSRTREDLENTAEKCQEVGLPRSKILVVVGDVTKEADVQRILNEAVETFGGLHVLVNNAGCFRYGGMESSSVDDLDTLYTTNVRSVYLMTKLALPHLIANTKKGVVVNVSSLAGLRSSPRCLAYCMVKAALDSFTRGVAQELAPHGVRVNSVNPGAIETDLFIRAGGPIKDQAQQAKYFEALGTTYPMQRVGKATEVSQAILFLASDAASFMAGACVPIDGGLGCTVNTNPHVA